MANVEHLEKLEQGVEAWNKWRKEENVGVDLSGANLSYKNLVGINLSGAYLADSNLSRAQLHGADLSQANLWESNLIGADLGKADLSDTDLTWANFSGAYLSNANLFNATLVWAIFNNCTFEKTILDNCFLNNTVFGITDLSTASGLETVRAGGECSIDFQTLRASKNLSLSFLRKIGLPENYISYLPDFYDESPLRLHPAFLSHSWSDKPFATKLYEALIKRNVFVWYDERKLKPGDEIREGISKGIELYDKFILVCSKNSLKESWWVDKEINRALDKEKQLFKKLGKQVDTIIPITIDDYVHREWNSPKKSDIDRYVIGDFKDWKYDAKFEKALDALVAALNVDRSDENVPSYL